MADYNSQIQAAFVEQEKTGEQTAVKEEITLSNGVVLKLKPFPPMRINAIVESFPYPPVPKFFNPEKGRDEENPLSQVYLDMKADVDMKRSMAAIDAMIVGGTELKTCPKNVPHPDTDDWVEELEVSHITVRRESKMARYLAWIKFVAAVKVEDLNKVVGEAGMTLGISESRIASAIQNNFPDNS